MKNPLISRRICYLPFLVSIFIILYCHGCTSKHTAVQEISKEKFGILPDGSEVSIYTMVNTNGMAVKILDYGCIMQSLLVPDKDGNVADIVLGFDSIEGYLSHNLYFGGVIGRFAGRIANGKFNLKDQLYSLDQNNFPNHLHGGIEGFDKKLWKARVIKDSQNQTLELDLMSPDGDQGYPGKLNAKVIYSLTNSNELIIDYRATCDQTTIVNLTNHSYFNLKDAGKTSIEDHIITIFNDHFIPLDGKLMPTGEIRKVAGTAMDFTSPKRIGDRIDDGYDQLQFGKGYSHSWLVNPSNDNIPVKAARLEEKSSGRILEVWTTQPAIHFYSGNSLDGKATGKNQTNYGKRSGLCLETQHYADSPNQNHFPSTVLNPGETYSQRTIFKFLN